MAALSSSLDQQQPPVCCGGVSSGNSDRRASAINFTDARNQPQQQQQQQYQEAPMSLVFSTSGDKSAQQERQNMVASGSAQESVRSKGSYVGTSSTSSLFHSNNESTSISNNEQEQAETRHKQMGGERQTPFKVHSGQEIGKLDAGRLGTSQRPVGGVRTGGAKDEADIVFGRLMRLEAFRKLHPGVIRNLCSYAFVERIEKGVIGE